MDFQNDLLLVASLSLNACAVLLLVSRGVWDSVMRRPRHGGLAEDIQNCHYRGQWQLPFLVTDMIITLSLSALTIVVMATSNVFSSPFLDATMTTTPTLQLADICIAATAVHFLYKLLGDLTFKYGDDFKVSSFVHHVIAVACYANFAAFRENRLQVLCMNFATVVEMVLNVWISLRTIKSLDTNRVRNRCFIVGLLVVFSHIVFSVFCLLYALVRENPLYMNTHSSVFMFFALLYYTTVVTWVVIYYITGLCRRNVHTSSVSPSRSFTPVFNEFGPMFGKIVLSKEAELQKSFTNNLCCDVDDKNNLNQNKKDVSKTPNELTYLHILQQAYSNV